MWGNQLISLALVLVLMIGGIHQLMAGSSAKSVVASRVSSSIAVDGVLDEEAWQRAVPVSGFQQLDPDEGAAVTEQTTVRVLYDDGAIYVGAMCYDSNPDEIVGQLSRRDRSTQADKFSVFIDSYHDHSTAFFFNGSISGVQLDALIAQDGLLYDVQWDAVWEFNAAVVSDGWSAEFRIPYSAIRFASIDSEHVWGINFRRFIARKKEVDDWVLITRKETPPGYATVVSKMGHLSGVRDIQPPLHVELLPYQVSRLNYLAQPEPFSMRRELLGTVGLDLKYGITNNFTLDLAVNPDFGQVEVDQAVLNLTVFETRYPEKRPFFLEGSQIFAFGSSFDNRPLQLLYPRRIGKRPSAYDTLWQVDSFNVYSNAMYREKPEVTTILGAGKLSGRTSDGLEVGVLSAATDEEVAVLENVNGYRSQPIVVEPRASYNVLRLRQNVWGNSWLGMMTTGTFKDRGFPSLSGGVDWNIQFGGGDYHLDGYLAGSHRSLAPSVRQSGSAGRLGFAKLSGEHWLAFAAYDFSTWNFAINDVGFYSQPREHGGYVQLSYKELYASEPLRRYAITLQTDGRWNWNGMNTVKKVEFEPSFEFRNFWMLTLGYIHHFAAYDDENRLSYRGYTPSVALYLRPVIDELKASLSTDSRKPVQLSLSSGYQTATYGLMSAYSVLQFTLRPYPWMELSPGFMLARVRGEEAWPVGYYTPNGLTLFGDRDVDQNNFYMRGTITFTRNISMQFFTQAFLAKGRYRNFRALVEPERLESYTGPSPVEFNQKILNANLVLRWEYLRGSTFYLVWTQARYGNTSTFDRSFGENFADTFRLPMDNVLLAKISYWWSL